MKRSPQRSQQQNSLNEDILEFIEQAEDNVINVQNQENFSSSKNKKPRIQKSKRMLSEEVLFQSSSMDEPLSSLKSENKKSSFSDSFSQEEFNLKEDLKIERSKKGYDSSHKQYTYTKKIIDFPKKKHKRSKFNSERKKFIYYYRYNYPKKHHFEDEVYDDENDENEEADRIDRRKKNISGRKNSPNNNDFNINSNNNSKISSINKISSGDQNKLNEIFSSSSESQIDKPSKKKIKKAEVNFNILPKENEYKIPKLMEIQIERPKQIRKKVIKKKFKKKNNSVNINLHKNEICSKSFYIKGAKKISYKTVGSMGTPFIKYDFSLYIIF